MRASILALCAALVLSIGTAAADDAFHAVPAAPDQGGPLELRVVSFGNGVHGEMVVEVRNPSAEPAVFFVSGLYFVPDDDGGEAPQRMGVIGGGRTGVEEAPRAGIKLAAGAARKVRLDVYCIDRSRHAPSSGTTYTLAGARMPARLAVALADGTRPMIGDRLGPPDDALANQIQEQVWTIRKRVRARLAGER